MQIYQVGGSVRDFLLGRPCEDRDWVVVGSTQQEMLSLGYRQVGADFPVFLHPDSNDEYALARLERKTGTGYGGFSVETAGVTLEEDLSRRDLTINAMALAPSGDVIDPFNGQGDVADRVLRHVSAAFSEDPLRVLRLLRFHARFGPSWRIADETSRLVDALVKSGELSALVPERIWKEVSRALMEPHAGLFLQGMHDRGLHKLPSFEPYRNLCNEAIAKFEAVEASASLEARFAVAFATGGTAPSHPTIPTTVQRLAEVWASTANNAKRFEQPEACAEEVHELMVRLGSFKMGSLLAAFLQALEMSGVHTDNLRAATKRAIAVDTRAITAKLTPGPIVGVAIKSARVRALANVK